VVLQTGAAWRFLPDKYPSPARCWRRLKQWEERGVWLDAWRALLGSHDAKGLLQWDETFLDGSFAAAKKGALRSAKPSAARERSGWYCSTVGVFRWEFGWKVPPPAEITFAEASLTEVRVPRPTGRPRQKPKRVIADRVYHSDPLRERLKKRGIDLIVPHRTNLVQKRFEDGRKLRRYKRRWIIERTNA
jgi:transposase